jgi:transcriptional regulator with XRE-family HTH domain
MPVDYRAPNINARSVGQHLRKIREILELSYGDAAAHLGVSADWLARVETGFGSITPDQVAEILDSYGTPAHIRDTVVDLASRPAGPPWLARHAGRLKALVRDIYTVESESALIHVFGIGRIPDLLRCEEYARLVFEHQYPEVDADEEWDLLRSRQQHRSRTLDVILDGLTLERHGGPPDIMRRQFTHLLEFPGDGRSTVRVVAPDAGVHPGLNGAFDVLEFPGLPGRISIVQTALGVDAAQADLWDAWQEIDALALSHADSRTFLTDCLTALV